MQRETLHDKNLPTNRNNNPRAKGIGDVDHAHDGVAVDQSLGTCPYDMAHRALHHTCKNDGGERQKNIGLAVEYDTRMKLASHALGKGVAALELLVRAHMDGDKYEERTMTDIL